MSTDNSWSEYRPSKGLWFWTLIGASALTMAIGFTWGGWTTAGHASNMRDVAVRNGRAELVSRLCVQKFVSSPDAAEQLAALKAKSYWDRDDFVEKGGWTTIAGLEKPVPSAAESCANKLVDMKELSPPKAATES